MQWTPDADAKLFMHVLKIHEVKLDYNALATAMGNDVTAKAITHRIGKIRGLASEASSADTSGLAVPPPRKRGPNKPKVNKDSNENKDADEAGDGEANTEAAAVTPNAKKGKAKATPVKKGKTATTPATGTKRKAGGAAKAGSTAADEDATAAGDGDDVGGGSEWKKAKLTHAVDEDMYAEAVGDEAMEGEVA